jgi:dihydroflavonol-4-reductase
VTTGLSPGPSRWLLRTENRELGLKAFVTGATGFLGSHVARVLAEQGAELRLLVRPTSDLRNLDGLDADRVVGDLRDAASIEKALAGCDVVFHVAADYRLWVRGRDSNEMYRSNVEGTRSLLEAARKQGVRRVVYTSSVATMGFISDHATAELRSAGQVGAPAPTQARTAHTSTVADENSPVSLGDMIGHYKRSKFMAEQVAFDAARSGVDVVIVNPTTPIGERDIKPTPTGRIVVDFLKQKFPAYVETGLNLVDATECARGHVQALEKGRSGERYILGGENLTLKQILDQLAAITGLPSPTVKVPYIVALAGGVFYEFTGRLLGREPRTTIDAVRLSRKMMFVSSAKAERELGWRTVPVDAALRRSVEWFRASGYA